MNRANASMTRSTYVLVVIGSLVFFNIGLTSHPANAQQTAVTAGTNFTKLLSQDKAFQSCANGVGCIPAVDVVYQGPVMLVLKSSYIDTIWKAVEVAKKEGYKIDGISTYITTSEISGGTVNVLVAMSKG